MRMLLERMSSFAMGVNDSAAPDEYLPQQVQVMINGRPTLQGNGVDVIETYTFLSDQINHTGASTSNCYGAVEFYTASGTHQIVAAFDDEMHVSTDGGRTFTQITGATSLRQDYWSFVIIREGSSNVLCCANGGTNSYQYDGTTWATISGIPSGTKYLAVMGNRLWASGGNGITVAASVVGDIDDWSAGNGALSVVAATNDGDTEVTGLFQLGSVLLVFKRKSVGYIEGFGYQTLQVETGARGISRSVGCVAFRTIAPLGDHGVMWLGEHGFYAYYIGGVVQLASEWQRTFTGAISYDLIREFPGVPNAAWWPLKQEYICALPVNIGRSSAGQSWTINNWMYCYRPGTELRPPAVYMRHRTVASSWSLTIDANGELDILVNDQTGYLAKVNADGELDVTNFPDPGNWVTTLNGELALDHENSTTGDDNPSALFVSDEAGGVMLAGTHSNRIMELERDTEPDGSTRQMMILRGRPFLFGDEFTRKKARRVTVLATQPEALDGTVQVIADGEHQTAQTLSFTATPDFGPQERKARVGGKGRVLQIEYRSKVEDSSDKSRQTITGIEMAAQLLGDQL